MFLINIIMYVITARDDKHMDTGIQKWMLNRNTK
jgi:hypothetical protein